MMGEGSPGVQPPSWRTQKPTGEHRPPDPTGTTEAGGHLAAEAVSKPSCPAELGGPGGGTGRQSILKTLL